MTAPPGVRGWCPGLHTPMEAADGWLVRVRPPLGRLSGQQAHAIARAARTHGNGLIELTSRGNLQLRGLTPDSARAFARDMQVAGLASTDAATEARRGLLLSPLAGIDPRAAPNAPDVIRALDAALAGATTLCGLPAKFVIAVECGGYVPTGTLRADITLRASGAGWLVICGARAWPCTGMSGVEMVLALAHALAALDAPARPLRDPTQADAALAILGVLDATQPAPQERHEPPPLAGPLPGHAMGAVLPPGPISADLLDDMARWCTDRGNGQMRIAPWRSIIFEHCTTPPPQTGLITDPADPRLRIWACIGARGCGCAPRDVIADALYLAPDLPASMRLHVSGCTKGCAHPAPTDLTLVAGTDGYSLCPHGRADDTPVDSGLSLAQIQQILRAWTPPAYDATHPNGRTRPA
ncbi:precorrin-3B synthase [Komagataeibacter rhaeticus]|uniref:precorrin-3B synthase n=1 Tax=Komagataeibacter rhaeticus TaxID=215221 RepID=UPI0004D8AA66|nr:precorrin-3B synthase [Komagataeibacter rhaeticus]KDU94802.1 precorrin-3B synthase [Komagataeibacter rhaeticus AF1]MBL7240329.1 precorrin-3B synthase [Komagataeibacter rhaeticus]PYD55062.1 precorrin-3B synthase [Komagataeibacter rhaeticus]GBQ11984.1 cobalamin biosynthesis protein precorrin-3B biosynthesis protein [Komagataeibacter rhaeticus DSM 16663]